MIRTETGFDETPAATVWNGPGRPRETWKRYEPSRRTPIEATRVMPRMRLTRVPGAGRREASGEVDDVAERRRARRSQRQLRFLAGGSRRRGQCQEDPE